mmetsp:Transcript_8293/g.20503  ORF Transcript_8293/g.20503 Transcript_8293/m.20503 type:complete len:85 (+) Transcript_8293:1233-1487(+)
MGCHLENSWRKLSRCITTSILPCRSQTKKRISIVLKNEAEIEGLLAKVASGGHYSVSAEVQTTSIYYKYYYFLHKPQTTSMLIP